LGLAVYAVLACLIPACVVVVQLLLSIKLFDTAAATHCGQMHNDGAFYVVVCQCTRPLVAAVAALFLDGTTRACAALLSVPKVIPQTIHIVCARAIHKALQVVADCALL
jgi:hypothetical protein